MEQTYIFFEHYDNETWSEDCGIDQYMSPGVKLNHREQQNLFLSVDRNIFCIGLPIMLAH